MQDNEIGKRIKAMRIERGMEQAELAEKLHISNKTVSSWECGRTEPKMGMIEGMCKVFGCQKTELIDGVDCQNFSVSRDEYEIIRKYQQSDDETKRMVDRLLAYAKAFGGIKK